jgi:uncharacterized protein (TIRG00374 family)
MSKTMWRRSLSFLLGLGLLAAVLLDVDLTGLPACLARVGYGGAAAILGIYALAFLADVLGWQLAFPTLTGAGLTGAGLTGAGLTGAGLTGAGLTGAGAARWTARLYGIRLAGEAVNNCTPSTVAGEPLKAWLLKVHYGIPYGDSASALVLAKTTSLLGLALFLAVAFVLLYGDPRLPGAYHLAASVGLLWIGASTLLLFLAQRLRLASRIGRRLGARPRISAWLERALRGVEGLDARCVHFYADCRRALLVSLGLAMLNWILGAVEIHLILALLDRPVGWGEAWIVEALIQMVRASAVLLPAALGVQEGAFVVLCQALTGDPTAGLATGLIKRVREVLWIGLGCLVFWAFTLRARAGHPSGGESSAVGGVAEVGGGGGP